MKESWVSAGRADGFEIGRGEVVKSERRQAAVFRLPDDRFLAVDNLCPHEGYPLAQGYVKDCVLTCAWHNFKFDLATGECLKGDEDVTTFPVRVTDGLVEVDFSERRSAADLGKLWSSLSQGLLEDSMGRVARDVVRLLEAEVAAVDIALHGALFDARYGEYGTTHALPVACDITGLLPRYSGHEAVRPVMQVMELASEPSVRRPPRPIPEPTDPGDDPIAVGDRLLALVEAEEGEEAESLFRGALSRDWDRDTVEQWLLRLCAEHFLSFGHRLIYVIKAFDLIDRVGWQRGRDLLPSLVASIATGTREDSLPPMAFLRRRLAELEPSFPAWRAATDGVGWDRESFIAAVVDGTKQEAAEAVATALADGVGSNAVIDALSLSAAERLFRFDASIDADPTVQEGWLDVTHTLTFANATRRAFERSDDPALVRLLFYAAHFVNRTRPLDLQVADRINPTTATTGSASVDDVVAAIAQQEVVQAVASAAAVLRDEGGSEALRARLEEVSMGDGLTRPIIVAHAIKTNIAAFDERAALAEDPLRDRPVLAAVRFLASPVQERSIGRLSFEAVRFVAEGRPPKRLTS